MNPIYRQSTAQVTSALIAMKTWEKTNLPQSQSTLAFEIFILIAHFTVCEKPLTLHQLFYSLEYSETGIRKQLAKLVEEGFCLIVSGSKDKRLKYVLASDRMLAVLDHYAIQLCGAVTQTVKSHKKILEETDFSPRVNDTFLRI